MTTVLFYVALALFFACGAAILVIAFSNADFRRLITGHGKDIDR